MTAQIKKLQKGFTLIELLVVIGILAVLLAITLIAINPARQFGQANDTKRRADVNAILNAIDQYLVDPANNGVLPAGITTTAQNISSSGANICAALAPKYIASLPADPTVAGGQIASTCPAGYDTKYQVQITDTTNNRITVSTTTTYSGTAITATR